MMSRIIIPADLASHHDAALRQAARAHLTLTIRQLMIDITQDPMALAKVVTGGRDHWRRLFTKDYHTEFQLPGECDHLATVLFDFFVKHAACNIHFVVAGGAKAWLDAHEPVPAVTESEIDEAWEVEIWSSEAAMAKTWEGSARQRRGRYLGQKGEAVSPPPITVRPPTEDG